MNNNMRAVLWASAILLAAYVGRQIGLSQGQSAAITMGLVAASIATMRRNCRHSGKCGA